MGRFVFNGLPDCADVPDMALQGSRALSSTSVMRRI